MDEAATRHIDVLIVGAGPTGLVLALWLTRLGACVRIIDKAAEPETTSRALGVQTRTLEFVARSVSPLRSWCAEEKSRRRIWRSLRGLSGSTRVWLGGPRNANHLKEIGLLLSGEDGCNLSSSGTKM